MRDTSSDDSTRFSCPRCQAFSYHVRGELSLLAHSGNGQVYTGFSDIGESFYVEGTRIRTRRPVAQPIWSVTLCASCNAPSVWRGMQLIFPMESEAPAPHPDMPEEAKELYVEAAQVLPHSRRAAAALARASLEAFLRETDSETNRKNLQARIAELKNQINPALWKVLTALRVVGNDSLHGDGDELIALYLHGEVAEVVEPFFGAINALVEELITQPRKADELYELIPSAKREAAERAATKRE